MKNAVIVKSFQSGLILYLDKEIEFEELLEEAAAKFKESERFFKDAAVAVSFVGRSLTLEEETRLVEAIMDNSSLNITCIVGRDEETERFYARALECVGRKKAQEESAGQFYRGTLRKGQILETESSIIVLGDVNPGSSVISAGDIVVLGSLRGNAYAGGSGRSEHYVAALEMAPQKLKSGISNILPMKKVNGPSGPKGRNGQTGIPEEYSRRWLMWKITA
ncbi:septum site-determining protein MinC [Eisenbergiella massiliensis]|uniref:septum site-determining protein MinC n=1 Tax=Eisenbergiella massiliensis TaxID=1720294 RepID=UPI002493151C|nr:septum site-determining protein MinC [Eisenbergiella massiliensis]